MVAMVRRGISIRSAAQQSGMSYSSAWMWVQRGRGKRLDRADLSDRPSGCRQPHNRVSQRTQRRIIRLRQELRDTSVLGEYGAAAIRLAMVQQRLTPIPSLRTIGRVLSRSGQLDARRRVRRPSPPPGWHLPLVAAGRAELDSFDAVEGLRIKNGPFIETLNGVSLHGKLVASWPATLITAKLVISCLIQHWKDFGLPAYAQFDNGMIFHGAHRPDTLGRVARVCLSLGVIPVFAPPREHGLQNQIEGYNALWQRQVWRRFQHASLKELTIRSDAYVLARRQRVAPAGDAVPRRAFPKRWQMDLDAPLKGRVIFIRRTNQAGVATILTRPFVVDRDWQHRLVRAELDLEADEIRFYRLRKREPDDQPLLRSVAYQFPRRPFKPRRSRR